jgi:hypothetical protein
MKYIIIAIVIVAVIVIFSRRPRSKPEALVSHSPDYPKPLLKQFGDLGPPDFEEHPVWVNCHVIDYDEPWYEETDEETFRPWDKIPADPSETMFLVKAEFTLADGTEMSGFITPQHPDDSNGKPDLGIIQPQVFLGDGSLAGFWFGIMTPSPETISDIYAALGKSPQEVFPIAFKVDQGLAAGITSGSIPGFCSYGKDDKIEVLA